MLGHLSRLWCRIVGHRWVGAYGVPMPFAPVTVGQVCSRTACRGRVDAARWH